MKKESKVGKMKDQFVGWYDYSDDELKQIQNDALIVVDTNILLDFYRYSNSVREAVFQVLEKYSHRLWIPYSVGKEFFERKYGVISEYEKYYDNLIKDFTKNLENIENLVSKLEYQAKSPKDDILDKVATSVKSLDTSFDIMIKREIEKKNKFSKKNGIETRILTLFNDKIGFPYEEKREEEIKLEGIARAENKIPPGYMDIEKIKNNPNAINGDYHIFAAIIDKAKNDGKDVIFITRDSKEDWYLKDKNNGNIIKARPEILNEFHKKTGQKLQIYNMDNFLNHFSERDDKSIVDSNIISKIKDFRISEEKNENKNKTILIDNDAHFISNYFVKNVNMYYISKIYNLRNKFENFRNKIDENYRFDDLVKYHNSFEYNLIDSKNYFKDSDSFYNIHKFLERIKFAAIPHKNYNSKFIQELLHKIDFTFKRELDLDTNLDENKLEKL